VSQFEVDFVIPRLGIDLPLGIDPFLLFKSRVPEYRDLHALLLQVFEAGIAGVRSGEMTTARYLFNFPEVPELGFGYTQSSKRGSGVGSVLTGLILDTLKRSPALQDRGVKHVEELQLFSAGIGPDRVSDIAGSILKSFLISYTQRQSALWNIPLKSGVPIAHVFDQQSWQWLDGYYDLPTSPLDDSPILLVPRRLVRQLPWINYDDFLRTEFRAYLQARRPPSRVTRAATDDIAKTDVVSVTRADVSLVEHYVKAREQVSADAQPFLDFHDEDACREAEALKQKLADTPVGQEHAAAYQKLLLEIFNFLFNPELIDGELEVRTVDGTERRDIIYTNDSDESFWDYLRNEHSSFLVMLEAKNVRELDGAAFNQTATYLGSRVGRFGMIVTRVAPSEAMQKKAFAIWNDSGVQRKVILVLCDSDIRELLDWRCQNRSPTKWLQRRYREFRSHVQ